ncbi:MAG: DUF3102 domain-containing protein [Candidatus Limiplasma sp.]|nr:DUF3102 domain-containing protein [Candidatus Limiplasma sp.]
MSELTNPTPEIPTKLAASAVRTADVIASEIIGIKEAARRTMQTIATGAAVEIGKRLKEAKALVPYGAWGEWLRVHVDYSERTAQNLLRIAEESAKGSFEALLGLNYTQAVQLIGLPVADREALLAENEVGDMSTRELQELVDRYRQEAADQQQTIAGLMAEKTAVEDECEATRQEMIRISTEAAAARSALEGAEVAGHYAKTDRETAAANEKKARERAEAAEKKAAMLEKQIARYEDELQNFRDRQTEIQEPQALAEVKATVVEVIAPTVQDEPVALRERERQRLASEATAAEAMKREGAEYTFRVLYEQFTGQFGKLTQGIGQMSPENQAKYSEALRKAMNTMLGLLPGQEEAKP